MSKHLLITIAVLLTSCGSGGGGDSHENSVDTVNYDICNEDGTINDLSNNEIVEPEVETPIIETLPYIEPETQPTAQPVNDLAPVAPGLGVGVLKSAILPLAQAEECAANQDCIIKATDGVKASVEHCGNVTIVLVPR